MFCKRLRDFWNEKIKARKEDRRLDKVFVFNSLLKLKALKARHRRSEREQMKIEHEHMEVLAGLLAKVDRKKISDILGKCYREVCRLCRPLQHTYTSSNRFQQFQKRKADIAEFLSHDDISAELPDMKFVGKRFLVTSMKQAHLLYNEECSQKGEGTISRATFCCLRPRWIRSRDKIPTCMSVCQRCQNVDLKARALQKAGVSGVLTDVKSGMQLLWCSTTGRFPSMKCAEGSCLTCVENTRKLQGKMQKAHTKKELDQSVGYSEWVAVSKKFTKDGRIPTEEEIQQEEDGESLSNEDKSDKPKCSKKPVLLRRTCTLLILMSRFVQALFALLWHVFMTQWQWNQFREFHSSL